jgi:TP901 family phage tail tape measure protein
MIEALAGSVLLGYLSPVALFTAAICLLVLRAGASRVFFDIVGTFQATKMISDAKSAGTVFEAIYLDAITGVQEAAQELGQVFNELTDFVVPVAREIQEAQIQLEKFVQEGVDVKKLVKEVEGIGLEFGFAGDEAMEAAAKMAQISGVLGPGTMGVGTRLGMEFALISGMETEAAMQRMINLQQQTKFMTENLEDHMSAEERANQIRKDSIVILDQLNTIENRSAATMEQITFVMNQFASQAHLANEEIKTMAALSAVMIETGEEQGKGGRALRMMYARLGSDIGGAATSLQDLGIAITDANGDMRPLSDILMQLEEQFTTMDGARQQEIAQVVAGNRHYTRFLKIMNNLDRVRELELEATLRMFPAMDEIQRRRDNELFQLEQSEANVRNLAGALGTQLLPAMTEISDKQAIFLKTVVALNEGPLGGMVMSMMALAKSSSVLLGPVVNTLINFKNMSIAFQTHAAITRALAADEANLGMNYERTSIISQDVARNYNFQTIALKNLNQELKIAKHMAKEANNEYIGETEPNLLKEAKRIEGIIKRTKEENKVKARRNQLQQVYNAIAHGRAAKMEESANAQKADIEMAKQQAQAFNGITMAMVGTGSAMMMIFKNQRMVRAGMVLNTAAMGAQVIAMMHKNREQVQNLFLTTSAAVKQAALTVQTKLSTLANTKYKISLDALKVSAMGAATSIKTFGKSLVMTALPFAALMAAGYAVTVLLEKIGVFADDAADSMLDFNSAVADTGTVLDILDDEAMTLDHINSLLVEKNDLLDNVKDSTSQIGRLSAQSLRQQIADLQMAREIRELADIEASKAQAATFLGLGGLDGQRQTTKLGFGKMTGENVRAFFGEMLSGERKEIREHNEALVAAQKALEKDYPILFSFIKQHEVENMEELEAVINQFYDDLEGRSQRTAEAVADDVGLGIDTMTDALEGFNNAREELFFGSRANMTGDLIRQVHQQGVENLIANTEVIMTNVFNGLTIPQMADMVIEEIESRGRSNGYNII